MDDQLDLFWVSAIDPPLRDNRDAMAYPFLALQTRRTTPITYSDENVWLNVGADSRFSIATIWDWDVMIFAASHLNEAIESRRKVSPRIRFAPYNCLKQIGRPIGGEHYRRLADAIRRLAATLVITNIREADQPETGAERGFHWLSGYRLPKKYPPRYTTTPDNVAHITPRNPEGAVDPLQEWQVELHPWLFEAILRQGDILAVHPDYFQLRGGIERWLYRLARKSVKDKATPPAIRYKMETLHKRSGVTGDLKHFAEDIRKIQATQPLPEYGVKVERRKGRPELVTLYRDIAKPCRPPRGRRLATIHGDRLEPLVDPAAAVLDVSDDYDPGNIVLDSVLLPTSAPTRAAPPLTEIADATPEPAEAPELDRETARRIVRALAKLVAPFDLQEFTDAVARAIAADDPPPR